MLRVLIVDDEPVIRDGLKTIINWKQYGFYICGEAANGRDGLAKAAELKPDLAIIDIKMPRMDGLQMIRELKASGIESSVIILTGYSEFEYAHKALEYGVEGYILKPIEQEELIDKLGKIYDDIMDKKLSKQYLDHSVQLSRDKVFEYLVTGQIDDNLIVLSNKLYDLKLPWKTYQPALILMSEGDAWNRDKLISARKEIEKFINENNYGYVFNLNGDIVILLKDVNFSSENIKPVEQIQRIVSDTTRMSAVMITGTVVNNIADISASCEHMYKLLEKRFIYGSKKIIDSQICASQRDEDYDQTNSRFKIEEVEDKLYAAIDVNAMDSINDLLERCRVYFMCSGFTEETIKLSYISIYASIINKLLLSNKEFKILGINNEDVFTQIYTKKSLQELHGYIKFKLAYISDELARVRPDSLMKKIIDYIERNYNNDIKLESLAYIFGYNSAYLGKMFKSYTGQLFNSYLEQVRLEKAKVLLKEGLKVYQVAERVGYSDIDYFYSKFRKYTGFSPTGFKNQL